MSILIKGMEMPTKENVVILINPQGGVWMIGDMPNEDTHLAKAKAVPVPPHGRLGDLDEFAKVVLNWITTQEKAYPNEDSNALSWRLGARAMGHQIYRDIEATPTIIPAEEGEEQREYEAQVEAAQYCEMYEPSYDSETGAL